MGAYDNWTLEPEKTGSTDSSGDSQNLSYWALNENVEAGMPEINSSYPLLDNKYADLQLNSRREQLMAGGERTRITLNFKKEGSGSSVSGRTTYQKNDGSTVVTLASSSLEKDIESHPNFLTNWKYSLFHKTAGTATPAFWSTATTTVNSDNNTWLWSTAENPGKDWKKIASKQKPDVPSYIVASTVVQEKTFYKKASQAGSAASTVGTLKVPSTTFGLGGSSSNWLVISANVFYEEGWWVAEKEYQYSDNYDSEVY